jgi:hypothetical protein
VLHISIPIDRQTLHHLLCSELLQVDTEDGLLECVISLGCDYCEFWDYIEVPLLTKDGVSLFVSKFPFDELRLDIWLNVIDRLAGISDANHRNRNCNRRHRNPSLDLIVPLSFQSVILNEFEGNSGAFCIPGHQMVCQVRHSTANASVN